MIEEEEISYPYSYFPFSFFKKFRVSSILSVVGGVVVAIFRGWLFFGLRVLALVVRWYLGGDALVRWLGGVWTAVVVGWCRVSGGGGQWWWGCSGQSWSMMVVE